MKIEQLRFRNLNSLAGEWVIDFTDRELSDEGIFLITGPTGAGSPASVIRVTSPRVLRATVLPPALPPLMTST